jgi:hypothetical protein
MKQLRALIMKEWLTNRTNFLLPVWFSVGVYVVSLIGLVLNLLRGNQLRLAFSPLNLPEEMRSIVMFTSSAGAVGALGIISMISSILLADSLLNGSYKRKCEIFHLTQPVSQAKIIGAKFLFMTLGSMLLMGVVSLVNSLVVSISLRLLTGAHLYFGITAWAQTFIQYLFPFVFVSTMFWFFAAIFKRKSFLMGLLSILAIYTAISILNFTARMEIPSLLAYIFKLSTIQFNLRPEMMQGGMAPLVTIVENRWAQLLDFDSLMRVIYSVIFFLAGSILYCRREQS